MSELEERLLLQIRGAGLPEPVRELRFASPRRWRFDLAWPPQHVAAEVDGGTWAMGRHTRGAGYESDCEKQNRAVLDGWRVLRFTASMVEDGTALVAIAAVLGHQGVGATAGNPPDFWAGIWSCAGCGTDCSKTVRDVEAHNEAGGLCAACRRQCEAGERCWRCCKVPCVCGGGG